MDVLNGFANGALSLVGAGEAYNKMGDLSSQLKSIQQETNELSSTASLTFASDAVSSMNTLRELIVLTNEKQQKMKQNTDQFINDSLQKENTFILFLYLLVFILIFFFLIQKNCCEQ